MKLLPLALLACLSSGCTRYFVPIDYDTTLNNYQSFIELDSVNYSMEFHNIANGLVTFWLEVDNQSQQDVLVLSDSIFSTTGSNRFDVTNNHPTFFTKSMSELDIDHFYKEKIKAAESAALAALIFGTVLIVADAASDIQDANQESWDHNDEARYLRRKSMTSAGLITTEIIGDAAEHHRSKAKDELRYLPGELFIRKRIAPGSRYTGKVVFGKQVLNKYYRIRINADQQLLNFDFRKAKAHEVFFLDELSRN